MKNRTRIFVLGLALFSMFFGGGNLIYPLSLGFQSGELWQLSGIGFFITGVLLPFWGVAAMIKYEGDVDHFLDVHPLFPKKLFRFLMLTFWIPLGSSPRCISLSFEGIKEVLPQTPLAPFALILCLAVVWVLSKKGRMIDVLGKFLTPVLLLLLFYVIFVATTVDPHYGQAKAPVHPHLIFGLFEGYNTMDLLASFFFSSSMIHQLHNAESKWSLKNIFQSFSIGVLLLALVYFMMIFVSSKHSLFLQEVPPERGMLELVRALLGESFTTVSASIVSVACFTTLVALTKIYREYLCEEFAFFRHQPGVSLFFTLFITFGLSLFGLSGVMKIAGPGLSFLYPILLFILVLRLFHNPKRTEAKEK